MLKKYNPPTSPLPVPAQFFILDLNSHFRVSISFYSALNIYKISLSQGANSLEEKLCQSLLTCTDTGVYYYREVVGVCQPLRSDGCLAERAVVCRVRKLLLGSLCTSKTSMCMN